MKATLAKYGKRQNRPVAVIIFFIVSFVLACGETGEKKAENSGPEDEITAFELEMEIIDRLSFPDSSGAFLARLSGAATGERFQGEALDRSHFLVLEALKNQTDTAIFLTAYDSAGTAQDSLFVGGRKSGPTPEGDTIVLRRSSRWEKNGAKINIRVKQWPLGNLAAASYSTYNFTPKGLLFEEKPLGYKDTLTEKKGL